MISNEPNLPTRPTCTVAQAAVALGVSVGTVYLLLRKGRLAGYAVGRRRIVFVDAVTAYQRQNAFQPAASGRGQGGIDPT